MRKERLLKIAIYITGFICLLAFIAVRWLPLFNAFLVEDMVPHYDEKTKYGELYYFSHVKHFREKMPEATLKHQFSNRQPDINEAEIFTFGDSFFDFSKPVQYPTLLGEALGKKVFFGYHDYPLKYLNANNYTDTAYHKILIMGIVERFFYIKFMEAPDTSIEREPELSKLREIARDIKDIIFYKKGEQLYDLLLKRSYLTTYAYTELATLKFDLYGYISRFTPVYSLNDTMPWLFHNDNVNDEPTSFYYPRKQEDIDKICDNLKLRAEKLKKIYNITLVFMPIPSHYTVYHNRLNNDPYNNFIPRLQEGLKKRNVHYIDIYSDFMKSEKVLYFGTDGHWNENGTRLALDLTLKYLRENNLLEESRVGRNRATCHVNTKISW